MEALKIVGRVFLHCPLISFEVDFESIANVFGFALLVREPSSQFSPLHCPLPRQFGLLLHHLRRIQTPHLRPILHHLHRQILQRALRVAWQQLLAFVVGLLDQPLPTQVLVETSIVIKESSIAILIFQQVVS